MNNINVPEEWPRHKKIRVTTIALIIIVIAIIFLVSI